MSGMLLSYYMLWPTLRLPIIIATVRSSCYFNIYIYIYIRLFHKIRHMLLMLRPTISYMRTQSHRLIIETVGIHTMSCSQSAVASRRESNCQHVSHC